jgi:thiol-disulfide isomerase/thioredoxin
MSTGAWVLLVAVVAALAFGGWRAAGDGRFHGTRRVRGSADTAERTRADTPRQARRTSVLADTPWADRLGERATLLQFSSAFCAPCRVTRRVLEDVAATVPGVTHVEVDAEQHLDLVRRLGVLRTPTTLVLDEAGAEVTRAGGAPRRPQVLAALAALEPPGEPT